MKLQWFSLIFSGLLFGCASGSKVTTAFTDGFPDIWWQALPEDQIASWEIPPQTAHREKHEVVLSKRNELGQFSNLQAAKFYLDGELYESVEGLWQSMKYPEDKNDERLKNSAVIWAFTREQVTKLSGFEAKRVGDLASANMKTLGITWVTYKGHKIDYTGKESAQHYDLILRACRAKLAAHPELVELLRRTEKLSFMADHKQKADSPPAYKYHEIYMKLRSELPPL